MQDKQLPELPMNREGMLALYRQTVELAQSLAKLLGIEPLQTKSQMRKQQRLDATNK